MPEPFEHHGPPPGGEAPRPPEPPPTGGVQDILNKFTRGGVFHRLGERIKSIITQHNQQPSELITALRDVDVDEFNSDIHDRVAKDLIVINQNGSRAEELRQEYQGIPKAIQNIVRGIVSEREMFSAAEIPVITTLIEVSIGRSDSNSQDMADILRAVYLVRDTNQQIATKVLGRLIDTIETRGLHESISADLLREVKEFVVDTKVETAAVREYQDRRKEMERYTQDFKRRIDSVKRKIEVVDEDSANLFVAKFPRVVTSNEIRDGEIAEFENFVYKMVREGKLTREEGKDTIDLMFDYFKNVEAVEKELERNLKEKGLKEVADWLGIEFSDSQKKILDKLSNVDNLADHLMKLQNDQQEGRIEDWWKTFTFQVRDVLEELFSSSLDAHPQDFFDQGFDQLKEGAFYKRFLQSLRNLGAEIDEYKGKNRNVYLLQDMMVDIPDVAFLSSRKQTVEQGYRTVGGKMAHAYKATKSVALPDAISSWLQTRMTSFKDIVEYFHNAEVISDKGMGFEQMAKFAERLEMTELDDILLEDPDLSLAYNLYIKSLHNFLSLHNRNVINAFGSRDKSLDLDNIQADAFLKFCVLTGRDPEAMVRGTDKISTTERKKLKRKIRMASGIAKGGTAEFWDALLTSRMLVSWERNKDGSFKVKRPYYGSQNGGYEKMIANLDLDLLEERFKVPGHWWAFRHVFHPRDLVFQEDTWFDHYDHNQVYDVMKWMEDARASGYSDELLDFDKKNIIFGDTQKTVVIDLMRRGSWRFAQYEADLIYLEGTTDIDYMHSLERMQRLGLYIVKRFLDDTVKDEDHPDKYKHVRRQIRNASQFHNVDLGEEFRRKYPSVNNFRGFMDELEERLHEKHELMEKIERKGGYDVFGREKKKLKEIKEFEDKYKQILYEVEIIQRMINMYPSQITTLERRRHTPKNETTLLEELTDFLNSHLMTPENTDYSRQYIESRVFPLFMSSVEVIEQKKWEETKVSGQLDYSVQISDFLTHRESLQEYFALYKKQSPKIYDRSTDEVFSIESMRYEQFEALLLEFFSRLRGQRDNAMTQTRLKELFENSQMSSTNFGIAKKRYEKNQEGKGYEQSLRQRLAFLLQSGIGELHHDIGGSDFDFKNFLMQQGGARATARMMNESHGLAEGLHANLVKFVNEGIHHFALSEFHSKDDLRSIVDEYLVKAMEEMLKPIEIMDRGQRDAYAIRMIIFIERLFAKDRAFRVKFIGDVAEHISRTATGAQASLIGDNYVQTLEIKANQLDSDDWKVVRDRLVEKLGIKFEEFTPGTDYQELSPLKKQIKGTIERGIRNNIPFPLAAPLVRMASKYAYSAMAGYLRPKPVMEHNPYHARQIDHATGLDWPNKITETFLPLGVAFAIAAIMAMIWAAREKEKEANGGGGGGGGHH